MLTHCHEILRRPAGPADHAYLRALFAEGRDDLFLLPADVRDTLLDMQFRAQRRQYAADHPQATQEILVVDETDVGLLVLDRDAERVHLVDLVVARAHRRRGIATGALHAVIAEAGPRDVTLHVWGGNSAARGLYERLGFTAVAEAGAMGYLAMAHKAVST